jgi:protein-S-isoprenylcysteine O-methyltransferase Ste14
MSEEPGFQGNLTENSVSHSSRDEALAVDRINIIRCWGLVILQIVGFILFVISPWNSLLQVIGIILIVASFGCLIWLYGILSRRLHHVEKEQARNRMVGKYVRKSS